MSAVLLFLSRVTQVWDATIADGEFRFSLMLVQGELLLMLVQEEVLLMLVQGEVLSC